MPGVVLSYILSIEADNDLNEIYDFTTEKFGTAQAIEYLTGLEVVFESLCSNPKLGRQRNEVRTGLRSISYESHVVFYRDMKEHIRIIRVLHGSRDIIKFIPNKD
jgi:toxin ParE1/3/4